MDTRFSIVFLDFCVPDEAVVDRNALRAVFADAFRLEHASFRQIFFAIPNNLW